LDTNLHPQPQAAFADTNWSLSKATYAFTKNRLQKTVPYTLLNSPIALGQKFEDCKHKKTTEWLLFSFAPGLSLPAVVMMNFTISVLRVFGPGNWLVVKRLDLHFLQKFCTLFLAQMMKVSKLQVLLLQVKCLYKQLQHRFLIGNYG